jgi:hypothetical protein
MSTDVSTAGAFSRLNPAPPACHAGAMKIERSAVDQRPQQVVTLMFLLTWGFVAMVASVQSLHFHAATGAVVVDADGLSSLQYQYTYTIAGQTCRQTVDQEPPLPKAGTEIQIHYDPESICDSSTFDAGIWVPVMGLAWMSALVPFVIWVWPRRGSE